MQFGDDISATNKSVLFLSQF